MDPDTLAVVARSPPCRLLSLRPFPGLEGSFSAVSTPILTTKHSFFGLFSRSDSTRLYTICAFRDNSKFNVLVWKSSNIRLRISLAPFRFDKDGAICRTSEAGADEELDTATRRWTSAAADAE